MKGMGVVCGKCIPKPITGISVHFYIDVEYASYDNITHRYLPMITAFFKVPTIAY